MAEKSILIIDDDQALVAAIKEGLETLGFRVAAAFDGLQGVLQAHQARPDAVMLDFNMPAGGGAGVYERLRSSTVTAQTPIVFLTAATVDEVKKVIRSTPNTYFLKKPISVTQLRKVLDKILGGAGGVPSSNTRPIVLGPAPAPAGGDFAGLGGVPPPPQPLAGPAAPPAPGRRTPTASMPLPPLAAASPAPFSGFGPGAPAPAPVSGGLEGQVHSFDLRVSYADTDRLGIVYYGTYLRYFEAGRTEFLRALGLRYRDLEMERRLFLPAVECRAQYVVPCRYDDQLRVKTWLSWLGPASVCFQNEVLNRDEGDRVVARGFTRHAVLNEQWKPARLPADVKQRLTPFVKTDS
ncbi:MAG: YbgC/FadM family acyl-CoA thioesterase [Elusimicrobia bacterium]|nr:YbgC/FadM family acyl-CoA thioesterase [Elusimicrobiota bacterium]